MLLLLLRRGRRSGTQLLDQLPDLRGARRRGIQREVFLVRLDGVGRVAGGLRRLGELEPAVRVLGLERGHLLPRAHRPVVRELNLLLEVTDRRLDRGALGVLDRVRAERRRELAGRIEALARGRELEDLVRVLVVREVALRLRGLEARELGPRLRVLALDVRVLLQRADRAVRVALGLVRRREVAIPLRLARRLRDLFLRLRDGRAAAVAEDVDVVE